MNAQPLGGVLRMLKAGLPALAAVMVLAACGASSGGDDGETSRAEGVTASDCVAKATEFIEPWDTPPTDLPSEYTPLSETPKAGLKVIGVYFANVPESQAEIPVAQGIAEDLQWDFSVIQSEYSPQDFAAKFRQAIAAKPDAIILESGDGFNLSAEYASARDAGIIVTNFGTKEVPTDATGLAAAVTSPEDFLDTGEIAANWVLRDSGCKANVAMFNFPGPLELVGSEFSDTLLGNCADCKMATNQAVQPTDVGTPALTNAIVSKLQSDSSINYVGVTLGSMSTGLPAALKAAGITGVKIMVFAPNDADLESLRKGEEAMAMQRPPGMGPYLAMDAIARVLDTGEPVHGLPYPQALMTPETVPGSGGVSTIIFPTDIGDEFKSLWQIG